MLVNEYEARSLDAGQSGHLRFFADVNSYWEHLSKNSFVENWAAQVILKVYLAALFYLNEMAEWE